MIERKWITINLPASLYATLGFVAIKRGITEAEICKQVIQGLSGLTEEDHRSLKKPPREIRCRELQIELEWEYLDYLSEATRNSGLTISSLFRKILHALLITHSVHFVCRSGDTGYRLEVTQMQFDFAENYGGKTGAT